MSIEPILINNLNFANNQSISDGRLNVVNMERLKEWVQALPAFAGVNDDLGFVDYHLQGVLSDTGLPQIMMALDVNMRLTCQRCLDAFDFKLKLNYSYLITALTEEAILMSEVNEQDDVDLLTVDKSMDVIALIEDEVIAALPFSPTHPQDCAPSKIESGHKPSPFEGLKDLIKKTN